MALRLSAGLGIAELRNAHATATRRRLRHDIADIKGFRLDDATHCSVWAEAFDAFHIQALPSLAVRLVIWYLNGALAWRLGRRQRWWGACGLATATGRRCRSSSLLSLGSVKRFVLLLGGRLSGWGIDWFGIASIPFGHHVRVVNLPLVIDPAVYRSGNRYWRQ